MYERFDNIINKSIKKALNQHKIAQNEDLEI